MRKKLALSLILQCGAPLLAMAREELRPFPTKLLLQALSQQEQVIDLHVARWSPYRRLSSSRIGWEPELLPLASRSWLYFNVNPKNLVGLPAVLDQTFPVNQSHSTTPYAR